MPPLPATCLGGATLAPRVTQRRPAVALREAAGGDWRTTRARRPSTAWSPSIASPSSPRSGSTTSGACHHYVEQELRMSCPLLRWPTLVARRPTPPCR